MKMISLMMAAALLGGQQSDCSDPQNQAEMNRCAFLDFQEADRALNAMWPRVIAAARAADAELGDLSDGGPSSEQAAREAQRAWVTFRDAHCTFEGHEARGGSMESMLYNGCRARLTEDRVRQMSDFAGSR